MHESEGRKHDLSENWEALNAKLQFEAHTHTTDNIESNLENASVPASGSKEESGHFKEKRAAHYNEFKVLKALKSQQIELEEDEGRA